MRAVAGPLCPPGVKVTLDGEELTLRCTEADDEEGWVDLIDLPAKLNADGEVVVERRYGKVVITVPEWAD